MSQTSTRVGWNGGLGWWAMKQCRRFMDFVLFIPSAQYAEYLKAGRDILSRPKRYVAYQMPRLRTKR